MAKLLPILKETVENAVGIESHANRYYYDNTTERFDNLFGGYVDGEYFVPVRFGLKRMKDGEVVLYVVVDQQKIKAEVLKATTQPSDGSATSHSAFIYNLSHLVALVNSKDLLRYLPDDMLSDEQKRVKYEGIAETIKYTNDKNDAKYAKFVASENIQAAQAMVITAAKSNGYTVKAYHGTNSDSFYIFDKGKIGASSGVSILGDGFYFFDTKAAAKQYGKNVYAVYLKQITPYIANDSDAYKLKAVDLERKGYDSVTLTTGKGDIYMVLDPEQIKSADPITYDSEGNVIPLSKRFNGNENDIRYQRRTATLSNREILEQAAQSVGHQKLTTDQRAALDEFKGHLAQLQKLEDRKAREEKIIQEAREKGAKQTEYQDAINRRNVLSSKIRRETETLLKLENTNVLRRVLQKANGVIVDEQTAERNRALADYRAKTAESRQRTKLRNQIRRVVK